MQLYGILAYPAEHLLSPLVFNSVFKKMGIRAEFKPFNVPADRLDDFFKKIKEERVSLSVSMPYTKMVKTYCGRVTNVAEKIGAINTLYWKDQDLMGHNTDFIGITKPLLEKMEIEGKKVIILGSGGVARAATYACLVYGAQVKILNRTIENAKELATQFKCDFGGLSEYNKKEADIIIQTSSVGMGTTESLLTDKDFTEQQIVFDCVYKPQKTQFLKNAEKCGATIITGDNMFIEQALEQFKLFVGKPAPIEMMRQAVKEALLEF